MGCGSAYMLAAPKQLSQLLAASVAPYEANPPSDAFDALDAIE